MKTVLLTQRARNSNIQTLTGEMSEWSMVAVLKTAEAKVSGGSNPSLSVQRHSLERCERGRIGLPAKELTWQTRVRGFESPPLRFFISGDLSILAYLLLL